MKKLVLVFALFGGFALASQAQNAPASASAGKTEEKAACSSSAKKSCCANKSAAACSKDAGTKKSCCANKSAKSCAGESKAEVAPQAPQMEKQ
jgi:hypothetical protein